MGEVNNKFAYLNHLSTPALERLLEFDPEGIEDTDPEMLLYILKVIEQRNSENTEARKDETEKTLQEVLDRCCDPERQGRWLYSSERQDDGEAKDHQHTLFQRNRRLRRTLLIAAAIVCMLSLMIPSVLCDNGFVKRIGQWDNNTFYFKSEDAKNSSNEGLMELQTKLDLYGITEVVVPKSLPDGFQTIAIDITEKPGLGFIEFYGAFEREEDFLSISIRKNTAESIAIYEKDDEEPEVCEISGITHYFYTNCGNVAVSWVNNAIECSMQGNVTMDDLKQIVYSIY